MDLYTPNEEPRKTFLIKIDEVENGFIAKTVPPNDQYAAVPQFVFNKTTELGAWLAEFLSNQVGAKTNPK